MPGSPILVRCRKACRTTFRLDQPLLILRVAASCVCQRSYTLWRVSRDLRLTCTHETPLTRMLSDRRTKLPAVGYCGPLSLLNCRCQMFVYAHACVQSVCVHAMHTHTRAQKHKHLPAGHVSRLSSSSVTSSVTFVVTSFATKP